MHIYTPLIFCVEQMICIQAERIIHCRRFKDTYIIPTLLDVPATLKISLHLYNLRYILAFRILYNGKRRDKNSITCGTINLKYTGKP